MLLNVAWAACTHSFSTQPHGLQPQTAHHLCREERTGGETKEEETEGDGEDERVTVHVRRRMTAPGFSSERFVCPGQTTPSKAPEIPPFPDATFTHKYDGRQGEYMGVFE